MAQLRKAAAVRDVTITLPSPGDGTFDLKNGEVKTALAGYDSSATQIAQFLVAQDAFSGGGPFKFNLGPINDLRQKVFGAALKPQPGTYITPYRRELIRATADATRDEQVPLALNLYTSLMEKHAELETQAMHDPQSALIDGDSSEAGEYLLRCLAVQATYDDFETYRTVLAQFLRAVAALRMAAGTPGGLVSMLGYILKAAVLPYDQTVLGSFKPVALPQVLQRALRPRRAVWMVDDPPGSIDEDMLRWARRIGAELARRDFVLMDRFSANADVRMFRKHVRLGAIEARGRVIRFQISRKVRWVPTRLKLTISLSRKILIKIKPDGIVPFNPNIDPRVQIESTITAVGLPGPKSRWPRLLIGIPDVDRALSLFLAGGPSRLKP